ncbi:MAG TPA: hypothetical protein VI298_03060 [Geobacteraceae bacterium]
MMRRPLPVLVLALGIAGTAVTAGASTPGFGNWSSQGDFETNASTTGTPTTRVNIDTTTGSGIRIGVTKDFVTTATITCVTPNRIYTTGVDRTSVVAVDTTTRATITIPLPGRAAGVVYNSLNNKVYVGQYDDNHVTIIDNSLPVPAVIGTIQSGTPHNGAYVAAYNSYPPQNGGNKVYIANTGDQTISIFDGATDSLLATVPAVAGATTASFDAVANKVYFTSKANQFVTIVDGVTNSIDQDVQVDDVLNLLGGSALGNVGLRVDAGITSADNIKLSWDYDCNGPNEKIQLQVRTATDLASLDSASYGGPTTDTWFETDCTDATSTTQSASATLNVSNSGAAEIQVKLSSDGLTTPVLKKVRLAYGFTVTASAGSGGSISPAGAVRVSYGDSQTFTVTPDPCYHIADVVIDGATHLGPVATYSFSNVTASHSISATFAINTYTITPSAGNGGSISPASAVTVACGGSQSFIVTPDPCYHTADVAVDGTSQGAISSYSFTNVTDNHTIAASFAINTYTVTFSAGSGGTISGDTPQTVTCGGSTSPVTATQATGNRFVNWTGTNGFAATTSNPLTVTNVTASQQITANFTPISFSLWKVNGAGGNDVAIDGSGNVYTGVPATVNGVSGIGIAKFIPPGATPAWVGTYATAPLSYVNGVSVDAAGNVYTASTGSVKFAKFTPPATTPVWTATGSAPMTIFADSSGNIYGMSYSGSGGNGKVDVYNFTAPSTYTLARTLNPSQGFLMDTALDSSNNLFYIASTGYYGYFAPGQTTPSSSSKVFPSVTNFHTMAIDNNNNTYVGGDGATYGSRTLYRIPAGATSPDWTVSFSAPVDIKGVAVDTIGNVYVAAGQRIHMYTPSLGTTIQWYAQSSDGGEFTGVAVDALGKHIAAVEGTTALYVYTQN